MLIFITGGNIKMKFDERGFPIWETFNKATIIERHGDMYKFRKMYEGKHHEIFERPEVFIKRGELIDSYQTASNGRTMPSNIRTPYIVINIAKSIVNVPSRFVSRSIGNITTNYPTDNNEAVIDTEDEGGELIEGTETEDINGQVIDLQQEIIDQISLNSKLDNMMNISQLQIDGGIVAVPIIANDRISIQFKERNVYYPHDDGRGVDLIYELNQTEEEKEKEVSFVHVHTEKEQDNGLQVVHRLYQRDAEGAMQEVQEPALIKEKLGIEQQEIFFAGRQRTFINYLANRPTFNNRLGVSELDGLESKQDEVNWSITRSAQTFQRNGKPKISVTREMLSRMAQLSEQKYGQAGVIDHEMLEVTSFDENGKSIEIHQIDVTKIGDINYIKELVRAMLAETETSEAAIEFSRASGLAASQSGIAKFYDLMTSIVKAEGILEQYIEFLKDCFESALWLANQKDNNIIIERPNIAVRDMIPTPRAEITTEQTSRFTNNVQSIEETVRQLHPDKSTEWINDEVERIEAAKSSIDSQGMANANSTLQDFMNNRDAEGNPLNPDGSIVQE